MCLHDGERWRITTETEQTEGKSRKMKMDNLKVRFLALCFMHRCNPVVGISNVLLDEFGRDDSRLRQKKTKGHDKVWYKTRKCFVYLDGWRHLVAAICKLVGAA